eukprot:4431937-Prymnesium_polylepis.1
MLRIGDCRDGCTLPAEPTLPLARPGGPEAATVASVSLCAASVSLGPSFVQLSTTTPEHGRE